MKTKEIKIGMRVAYVPMHTFDPTHPDVKYGVVKSVNHRHVFVKLDKPVVKLGYEGMKSISCQPSDLMPL